MLKKKDNKISFRRVTLGNYLNNVDFNRKLVIEIVNSKAKSSTLSCKTSQKVRKKKQEPLLDFYKITTKNMIDEIQKSKDLIDNEQYESALNILNRLKELPPKYENLRLLFSSICLYNLKDYKSAIDFADKVLQENEKNEFASQIKYLSYFELKEYDTALNEIISFLSKNKADLYKVTLEELLIDIKDGFINKDETISKIKELALKNNADQNIMDF